MALLVAWASGNVGLILSSANGDNTEYKYLIIKRRKLDVGRKRFCFLFVLFAIFILHSRESELYRYTLDGKSALAWELPFSRFMGLFIGLFFEVFHIKVGRPVKFLAQGHNKRTCRLVLHNLP